MGMCGGWVEEMVVRAQAMREPRRAAPFPFSRLVRQGAYVPPRRRIFPRQGSSSVRLRLRPLRAEPLDSRPPAPHRQACSRFSAGESLRLLHNAFLHSMVRGTEPRRGPVDVALICLRAPD
jgi:hypothetical protein